MDNLPITLNLSVIEVNTLLQLSASEMQAITS